MLASCRITRTVRQLCAPTVGNSSVERRRAHAGQDRGVDFPAINGFGHIDFTVTDVERSARWWEEVMGFQLVAQEERSGFTVWNVFHPSFLAIGLDRAALDAWAKHFDDLGVEHSGVREENGGPLITFRDPDNIQLELWAFDPDLVKLSPVERSSTG